MIFGMPAKVFLGRLSKALGLILVNVLLWYLLPSVLYRELGLGELPIEIVELAIAIAIVSAIGGMFHDRAVGQALLSLSSLMGAFFIYTATHGGRMEVEVGPLLVKLRFESLVYLLMLPSVMNSVRHVWLMIDRSLIRSVKLEEVVEA